MLDNIENISGGSLETPAMKSKIEQFAKEKGVSIEAAKNHFLYAEADQQ